jgi:hypothetical protein
MEPSTSKRVHCAITSPVWKAHLSLINPASRRFSSETAVAYITRDKAVPAWFTDGALRSRWKPPCAHQSRTAQTRPVNAGLENQSDHARRTRSLGLLAEVQVVCQARIAEPAAGKSPLCYPSATQSRGLALRHRPRLSPPPREVACCHSVEDPEPAGHLPQRHFAIAFLMTGT